MWASLHAPVATFAFFVADHDNAGFLGLAEGFFRAGGYAFGVFAGSACQRNVEEGFHADNANSAAQRVHGGFAFFDATGVLADSAASALGGIYGDEFSFGELGWHRLNVARLRYLNISVKRVRFND